MQKTFFSPMQSVLFFCVCVSVHGVPWGSRRNTGNTRNMQVFGIYTNTICFVSRLH